MAVELTEIYNTLTELARDLFSDETLVLTPATTAADVDGWDSFTHLSLIVAVETRFNIRLSTKDIDKLYTVGDLAVAVHSKIGVEDT